MVANGGDLEAMGTHFPSPGITKIYQRAWMSIMRFLDNQLDSLKFIFVNSLCQKLSVVQNSGHYRTREFWTTEARAQRFAHGITFSHRQPSDFPTPWEEGKMSETTHCKSCGAACRWVRLVSGKAMLIDVEACPDGNVIEVEDGRYAVTFRVTGSDRPRYKSHFVTCPHAALHRKPRQKDLFADREE